MLERKIVHATLGDEGRGRSGHNRFTVFLIKSDFVLVKEGAQVLIQLFETFVGLQLVSDPLAQLHVSVVLLVSFVDQENARVVVLVADAPPYYLVHFADGRHLVPVLARDRVLLVVNHAAVLHILILKGLLLHSG